MVLTRSLYNPKRFELWELSLVGCSGCAATLRLLMKSSYKPIPKTSMTVPSRYTSGLWRIFTLVVNKMLTSSLNFIVIMYEQIWSNFSLSQMISLTNRFYEYRCHPLPSSTHYKVFSEGANYTSATLHWESHFIPERIFYIILKTDLRLNVFFSF